VSLKIGGGGFPDRAPPDAGQCVVRSRRRCNVETRRSGGGTGARGYGRRLRAGSRAVSCPTHLS
jgi:hypothetical protein